MRFLNEIIHFLIDLVKNRNLIFELAKRDFKTRYLGSYLGIIWAFAQPMVTICVFWFVFEMGFKSGPVNEYPYILWLLSGMIPWFFVSESIARASNAIIENSYLVKKVVFRVDILPLVKILSALFIHLFFIMVMFSMFLLYGFPINIYSIQVFYYLWATIFLVLSVSWITSALTVFIKDVGHIIGVILQFAFWATPIFWNIKMLPPKYQTILKLNPLFYIVDGYRNALIEHKWFWVSQPTLTLYFWIFSIFMFTIGIFIFRKLKPHFADVL
jgi:lipopolysaccharide transport system permease protein/teichoic acid transport system permease protein